MVVASSVGFNVAWWIRIHLQGDCGERVGDWKVYCMVGGTFFAWWLSRRRSPGADLNVGDVANLIKLWERGVVPIAYALVSVSQVYALNVAGVTEISARPAWYGGLLRGSSQHCHYRRCYALTGRCSGVGDGILFGAVKPGPARIGTHCPLWPAF